MSTNPSHADTAGRVAAIDYGTVRIGIALSDPGRTIASPFENYTRRGDEQDARRFQRLVDEEEVKLFVVGLPVHSDGSESQKSTEARAFGAWLAGVTGREVVYFDERFTTAEAERFLLDANLTSKRRRQRLDKVAAQILLAAFLEAGGRGQENVAPLE